MIDVTRGTSTLQNSAAIMSATDVYVINLCASMTPMPSVPRSLKGYENHRLYQINRVEDGRHRYRLRLGFFSSEADAEIALASLRSLYPAAFTSHAGAEDMRYNGDPLITGRFEARPTSTPSEAKPPVAAPVITPAPAKTDAKTSQTKPAVSPVSKAATPVQSAPVTAPKQPAAKAAPITHAAPKPGIEPVKPSAPMSLLDPPAAAVESPKERSTPFTMTAHQPFHVARGVDLPDTDLELAPTLIPVPPKFVDPQWVHLQSPANKAAHTQTPPAAAKPKSAAPSLPIGKPAAKAAPVTAMAKSAPTAPQKSAIATPAPAAKVAASAPVVKPALSQVAAPVANAEAKPAAKVTDDYVPILDTTMTIRTISVAEMEDANQPKWFSVQLALSEQSFNLDAMPRLDIFAAYRVYSVAMHGDDGKLKHSLRLGFFKEEVSADAVAGYLKTFFPAPTITRVGVAEYERFIEPKVPEAPTPESKVVNLVERRDAGIAPSKPTFGVTPAPSPDRPKPQKAQKPKWETQQPGVRPGPTGKYSVDAMKKNQANASTADSGIRKNSVRPQSFLSKLIGRELD